MEYDEYMKKCEEIWGRNEKLIALFKQDISDLSEKTINNHVRYVKFYIDDFLTFREPLSVEEGVDYLNECFTIFLTHFRCSQRYNNTNHNIGNKCNQSKNDMKASNIDNHDQRHNQSNKDWADRMCIEYF